MFREVYDGGGDGKTVGDGELVTGTGRRVTVPTQKRQGR